MTQLSPKTPNTKSNRRKVVFAATVTALLLVTGLSALYLQPWDGPSASDAGTESVQESSGAVFDADQTVADAIAEIEAIATAGVSAVAEAGAQVGAEYNASLDAAGDAWAQAASEAEGAVAAAGEVSGNLSGAPESYVEGDAVVVEGTEVDASEFESGSYEYSYEFQAPGEGGSYEESNSSFEARAALNLPSTGIAETDAALGGAVDAYVTYKAQLIDAVSADNNVTILLGDGIYTVSSADGYTYYEAPDQEGAEAAMAHANATIDAAWQAATAARAGVNASWEVELTLVAETEAQIEAAAEAAAQAKAEVSAEAEAKAGAEMQAAFDKEVEIHEEAALKLEEARSVQKDAKAHVQAETQGQVDAMYAAALEAEESLEAKAQDALQAGADAEEAIWAAADAQLAALAKISSESGVDTSAQAEAIANIAAEQAANARYTAQYTHDLFMKQAANARANAEIRASAMWQAAAEADARIDAQAEVAVKVILRAEAYAVARVHAEAEAKAEAYFATAHRLSAEIDQRYSVEVRALIRAAFSVHFANKGNLDTSRDLAQMIKSDMDVDVTKDVDYMRTVAGDYERREMMPEYEGQADYWYTAADSVETDGTGVTQYVDLVLLPEIDEKTNTFVGVGKDLEALQQKWG